MPRVFSLRILLESDAGPGTGEGRAGGIDREVPHDAFGLPVLPGRRIKGLLREASLDLEECGLIAPGLTDGIFGTGLADGWLRAGNAELEAAAEMRRWLAWCRVQAPHDFSVEQVLRGYTYLRQQTAISRETGAPADGTLRRIRVLNRGQTFISALDLDDAAGVGADVALALACAAARRLGTSRNRGFGRLQCRLWEGTIDQTQRALAQLGGGGG